MCFIDHKKAEIHTLDEVTRFFHGALMRRVLFLSLLSLTLPHCSRPPMATAQAVFDTETPKGEPRAQVTVRINLHEESECEQNFDLHLYTNRAIEKIAWERATGHPCRERIAHITFLSQKTSRRTLLDQIWERSLSATLLSPSKEQP